MAEIDGGALSFKSVMDNDQMNAAIDETLRRVQGLSDGTVVGGQKMDAAFDNTADGIRNALGQIGAACEMHEQSLQNLEAEYQRLGQQAGAAFMAGRDEEYQAITQQQAAIKGEMTVREHLIRDLQEQSNRLEDTASKMEENKRKVEENANAHVSMRTRIKEVREEMMLLVDQGIDEQSEAYQRLKNELGRLIGIQGDVAQQGKILANDEQKYQGIIQGLSGLAGGFSAVTGTVSLFAGENEDLQKVMTKVQSVMAITIGLQQVAQTLNKDSAFMLVTVRKAKELLTIAEGKFTVALGISNVAAKALMATLTLGLSVAIGAAIYLWDKFSTKSKEAQKAQEEFSKSLIEGCYKPIGTIEMLSTKYAQLGDDMEAKKKFIQENKKAFDELGVSVKDVADAQNLLIDNKDTFIAAQIAKAKAMVYTQQAMEETKNLVEAQQKLESTPKTKLQKGGEYTDGYGVKRKTNATIEVTNPDWTEANDAFEKAQGKVNSLFEKAANAEKEGFQELKKVGQDGVKEYANGTIGAIEQAISEKQAKLKELMPNSKDFATTQKEITTLQKQLDGITGKKTDKAGKKKDGKDAFEEAIKNYKSAELNAQKALNNELNTLERSRINDKIALIEYDRDKTIEAIEQEKQAYIDLAVAASNGKVSRDDVDTNIFTQRVGVVSRSADMNIAKEQERKLQQMQDDYSEYATKLIEIEQWKNDKIREINTNEHLSSDQKAEQVNQTNAVADFNIDQAKTELGDDVYEIGATLSGIVESTIQQGISSLLIQIPSLQARLETLKKSGTSAKEISIIQAQLTASTIVLRQQTESLGASSDDTSRDMQKNYKKAAKALDSIIGVCRDVQDAFGDILDDTGKQVLDSVQTISSATIGIISLITTTAWTGAEAIKGVEKASVILAIIGTAIQIIMAIVNAIRAALGNQDAELEASIERKKKAVKRLEVAYNQLERAAENALGGKVYELQRQQIQNLQEQQELMKKMEKDEKNKKKSDEEKIQEYADKQQEIKNQVEDLVNEMREDILQTDAKTFAGELGDALVQAFGKGEDAAKAFDDVVNNVMRNAVLNQLKKRFLEQQLQGALDGLYKSMGGKEDGTFVFDGLSESEIAAFKNQVAGITTGFNQALSEYSKIFKDIEMPEADTSLTGAVKGVSEETASIVAGQMNAIRINQMEATAILRQQLAALATIANNTSYNFHLAKLERIVTLLENSQSSSSLRSQGLL